MIKSLRKKFIIVAMCSTFVVLTVLMGIVNIANYRKVIDRADNITEVLAENGGKFRERFLQDIDDENRNVSQKEENMKETDQFGNRHGGMSPETPFSTRYFTVTVDEDGDVLFSDLGRIAAVTEEEAEKYAIKATENSSPKGFEGIYRYRVFGSGDNQVMIIFLDCSLDLENVRNFALTCVMVSALGLLATFILVVIFSKIVFRPVEESYKKQKQFITDASHELKTPLTIIDANTEVLEMENGENQWTKSTRNQTQRLSALTQQLITLSRLDEKENLPERIPFCLSDAVFDTVEPFQTLVRVQEKRLHLQIEENIRLAGNEQSIRQLIGILLDNAVKYSVDKDTIQVLLKQKGKKIFFEVTNQAEGLSKGNYDILFERFYRMDASRNSETGGMGIGLSVAKAIVLSHKGKITACSEDGTVLKIAVEFLATEK